MMMLCYRDKTFCMANCKTVDCSRILTEEIRKKADDFGAPIAMADFSDDCEHYKKGTDNA